MTDQAIYDMMVTIKDGWHHFDKGLCSTCCKKHGQILSDDHLNKSIEDSLKNIARRVFGVVKQYSNPDLDLDAIVEETWLNQSHMGSWTMFPDEAEQDNFDEYVANWKYPRKENK